MKKPWLPFLLLFSLAAISACGTPMNIPEIKHNPHPKMRYEITMVIKDAPGPFESVEGYMSYEIINEQCAPFEKFAGIYRIPPSQHPSFLLSRISDNEYKGIVYLDLLQDEDYYGLGVCHWKLSNVGAQLKAGKMAFSSYISATQVISQRPSSQQFYRSDYGVEAGTDGAPSRGILGTPATEYLKQHPEQRFEITMIAKERFE